jgi:hypothetical protein
MGFNKRYIPELESLKEIREKMGDDDRFLDIYLYKPDAIIGSPESMEYLKELAKLKETHNG